MSGRSSGHYGFSSSTVTRHASAIPMQIDLINIPKRRSSLRGTVSGNSTTLRTKASGLQATKVPQHGSRRYIESKVSMEYLEDLTEKISTLDFDTRPPLPRLLHSSPEILFTPEKSPATSSDRQTPTTSPYEKKSTRSLLSTPTRRKVVSYGDVVDTTPSSLDRFIPSRRRIEDLISNFRVNKPFHELTPVQKKMRLSGIVTDPFTARRVTPQFHSQQEASNSTLPPIRATSAGDIWSFGGLSSRRSSTAAVDAGRGISLESGTFAPVFKADFFDNETPQESHERYEGRLAAALGIDQSSNVLDFSFGLRSGKPRKVSDKTTKWKDGRWVLEQLNSLLDAPLLRDDFYCSVLAHDPVTNILAVALKHRVYLWSEARGSHRQIRDEPEETNYYVSSLSFSSLAGGKSILAIGRSDGQIALWRYGESEDRIVFNLQSPVACLAFKPVLTKRLSIFNGAVIPVEELLVGDKLGNIYYFCVEWPLEDAYRQNTSMVMLARLALHTQGICNLTWSLDGQYFASGANDNLCFLVATNDILNDSDRLHTGRKEQTRPLDPDAPEFVPDSNHHNTLNIDPTLEVPALRQADQLLLQNPQLLVPAWPIQIGRERARYCWPHAAAIKAIAFCPWQKGLIATGGGSNDRAIHFFHTGSGARLATIKVYAQVTSLIWSRTRREICATFGYAVPEHPYRIAVFTWPACVQVLRIPWHGNIRALYAIPYPLGPSKDSEPHAGNSRRGRIKDAEGGIWWSRTREEGCIVVASSDENVKFHEVWSGQSSSMGSKRGGLAWSSILESEEGGDIGLGSDEIIR